MLFYSFYAFSEINMFYELMDSRVKPENDISPVNLLQEDKTYFKYFYFNNQKIHNGIILSSSEIFILSFTIYVFSGYLDIFLLLHQTSKFITLS